VNATQPARGVRLVIRGVVTADHLLVERGELRAEAPAPVVGEQGARGRHQVAVRLPAGAVGPQPRQGGEEHLRREVLGLGRLPTFEA
jgi:hypothetical protein